MGKKGKNAGKGGGAGGGDGGDKGNQPPPKPNPTPGPSGKKMEGEKKKGGQPPPAQQPSGRQDAAPPPRPAGGQSSGQTERDIMVPGRKVGLVIGRGGETINRLMHETGARMWVDQQSRTQDAEFKRLNIKGTVQQVEDALKLVNEIIGETAPQQQQQQQRTSQPPSFQPSTQRPLQSEPPFRQQSARGQQQPAWGQQQRGPSEQPSRPSSQASSTGSYQSDAPRGQQQPAQQQQQRQPAQQQQQRQPAQQQQQRQPAQQQQQRQPAQQQQQSQPAQQQPQRQPAQQQQQSQPAQQQPQRQPAQQQERTPPPQQQPQQSTPPVSVVTRGVEYMSLSKPGSKYAGLLPPKRADRPQSERRGRSLMLETNHLLLSIKDKQMKIYHYDVRIEPEKPFRFYRPAMEEFRRKHFGNRYPSFDGKKNLYSATRLPFSSDAMEDTVTIHDVERAQPKEVKVFIQLAAERSLAPIIEYFRNGTSVDPPQAVIQAIDVVLRQPAVRQFTPVGRSYFTPPQGNIIQLGDGLNLWYGFFQSAILGGRAPYLNIDVAHKGFPVEQSCIDALRDFLRGNLDPRSQFRDDDYALRNLRSLIKGLKVIYKQPRTAQPRIYKVTDIGKSAREHRGWQQNQCEIRYDPENGYSFTVEPRDSSRTIILVNGCYLCQLFPPLCRSPSTFHGGFEVDGRMTTVEQYFQTTYGYTIQYPHVPCIIYGTKGNALPAELCTIMGNQVVLKKLNENQTRVMVKAAATAPHIRKDKIVGSMRALRFGDDPHIAEFGLGVNTQFKQVEARVLPPPTIQYNQSKVRVERGVWNSSVFLQPKNLENWVIYCADMRARDPDLNNLEQSLIRQGRDLGMNLSRARIDRLRQDNPREVGRDFERYVKDQVQLVFVVLPERASVSYAAVKQIAEITVGLLTQCLRSRTVSRLSPSTVGNILLKVNAKLNGVNHNIDRTVWPDFFKRPVIVVGADVTHPSPDQTEIPSVAAVTASHDACAFHYNMKWRLQNPREEIISDLENIMAEQLLLFYQQTKHKPEHILFYRDGVSEGQFKIVLDSEVRAVQMACRRMGDPGTYQPRITFLVVQKRHHTRFFPMDQRDADRKTGNVPAGTIVDRDIVHPNEFDFYLVSHASIQGTARPTKYHVLYDDAQMPESTLEEITYYLCHLFTRCTRSVSIPAPTYYAHLAAFRIRAYIERQVIHVRDLSQEEKKRKIQDKIMKGSPMFFV